MDTINVLAFDLGASSGRGMLARFDGTKITLEEVHRFPHNFSVLNGRAYWNIVSLYEEMKEGMRLCKEPLSGVGFDTWGVDCGMIDAQGNLLGMPGSYRDAALDQENMDSVLASLYRRRRITTRQYRKENATHFPRPELPVWHTIHYISCVICKRQCRSR